jgi:glucosamine--fructose-6-phosphate aminotransferase (isomerizing)
MCGIVGYIGPRNSVPILVEGLQRLEYRGYDSAGIAVLSNGQVNVLRREGNLKKLKAALDGSLPEGQVGVGHTRWATHGAPCERNAHPHLDCSGRIALVHNGIIENFLQLREELENKGHNFVSDTDTETIVHLIEDNYEGDLFEAVRQTALQLKGSFAIAVISSEEPDCVIAARRDSPLIIGAGQGECFVASDIPAILNHTREILILDNDEIAVIRCGGFQVCKLDKQPVNRELIHVTWDAAAAEKGGFEDFMLKEIFEQPAAIRETVRARLKDENMILGEEKLTHLAKKLEKVYVVACGTSYHAGLVAKRAIEEWASVPVEVDIASEFRYKNIIADQRTLIVAISQSGETADTLASVRAAQAKGAPVLAISNVVGSSITREADSVIYTHAGPEIGVAATKTLVAQMAAVYLLALYLAQARETLSLAEVSCLIREIQSLPMVVEQVLKSSQKIKECALKYVNCQDFLFLGRGIGLPVALEGALKLKEISYIHAEGYPAGEMKHGPIALIEKKVPVVVVATKSYVYEKILGNIQEVKARGADVIAVASEGDSEIARLVDHVFFVPETHEIFSAVPAVVPLQLLAYYIAKARSCNVDQPRNLAKSVTVE